MNKSNKNIIITAQVHDCTETGQLTLWEDSDVSEGVYYLLTNMIVCQYRDKEY